VSFYNETLDLILGALEKRFSPEVLPLLKSVDCLVRPSMEKEDSLRRLASYYPRDVDEDLLAAGL
jgi:hypothetical protein